MAGLLLQGHLGNGPLFPKCIVTIRAWSPFWRARLDLSWHRTVLECVTTGPTLLRMPQMYMYIHTYVYIYIHIFTYTCIYIYIHVCTYIYVYLYVCMLVSNYTHIHIHV